MSNVVAFHGITKLDTDPQRVLEGALEAGLTEVIVIGFDKDGDEFFASSQADGGDILWHIERAKLRLLRIPDEMK